MNWFISLAQQYPYRMNNTTMCRIVHSLPGGKILLESSNGRRFEMYESQFRKKINSPVTQPQTPQDQLCRKCGHLNRNNECSECGYSNE